MLLVISPAKNLDFETPAATQAASQPRYLAQSEVLIEKLQAFSIQDIASLMKLSDKLAGLNLSRFQSWSPPFNADNAKQAVLAFNGDVYMGLDASTLDEAGFDFAQKHLRILSGLYGVLKPLDYIQPYRLEMGTKLVNNKGKNLYEFWGSKVSEVLNDDEDELIVNLASNEYFKSIDKKTLKATILNIAFKEKKSDTYKIIGIFAKRARGLMVNYIIRNRLNEPEALKSFADEGYQFSSKFSDDSTWVFTRG